MLGDVGIPDCDFSRRNDFFLRRVIVRPQVMGKFDVPCWPSNSKNSNREKQMHRGKQEVKDDAAL